MKKTLSVIGKLTLLVCVSLVLIFAFSYNTYSQNNGNNVTLKGIAKNFNNQVRLDDNSRFSSFSLPDPERTFIPDSNGRFVTSFKLEKAGYFRVGRNIMFLTPGDDLDMEIDYKYADKAKFSGRGAGINTYLKDIPFPRGGSFLGSGHEIKDSYESTIAYILMVAEQREKVLLGFKDISPVVRRMEEGRLKADIINSIADLRDYFPTGLKRAQADSFHNTKTQALIEKYARGFYQADLLDIEVYRYILPVIHKNSSNLKSTPDKRKIENWEFAEMIADRLTRQTNKDSIRNMKASIEKVNEIYYRILLQKIADRKMLFGNGDAAKDFVATDEKNELHSLNKYKGSVIYVDIWATWCMPCLKEFPILDSLREKYKDKNIKFISISIDRDVNEWKDYLKSASLSGNQWIIDRVKLDDYAVVTVPRTIIIDKDFKIVDLYAPVPSSKQTIPIIESLLK